MFDYEEVITTLHAMPALLEGRSLSEGEEEDEGQRRRSVAVSGGGVGTRQWRW